MDIATRTLSTLRRLEADLEDAAAALEAELRLLPRARAPGHLQRRMRAVVDAHRTLIHFLRAPTGRNADKSPLPPRVQSVLARAQRRARMWPRIAASIEAQVDPVPRGLAIPTAQLDPQIAPLGLVYEVFVSLMHQVANPHVKNQTDDSKARQMYDDIPLSMSEFVAGIAAAYRLCLAQRKEQPLRFLDVGCGGGTKLLSAQIFFQECDGLEYDPRSAATGAALMTQLGRQACRVRQGDAYEFTEYASYDVIYFYRPMMQDEDMLRLERLIFEQAAPGTILFAPFDLVVENLADVGAAQIADRIFVAGMAPDAAEELRKDAETMGTTTPAFRQRDALNPGYWRSLQEACIANGYSV